MMLDTWATVSIVTQHWLEVHGLAVKPTDPFCITSFMGAAAKITGKVNLVVQMGALELQLSSVMVHEGTFYQGILGGDVWMGKAAVLGLALIQLPGGDAATGVGNMSWPVLKAGVTVVVPFLPIAGKLPSTPPRADANQPPPSSRFPAKHQTTLQAEGVQLPDAELTVLWDLTATRQKQRGGVCDNDTFKEFMREVWRKLQQLALPHLLAQMLQCIYAHSPGGLTMLIMVAQALGALKKGGVDKMAGYLAKQAVTLPNERR